MYSISLLCDILIQLYDPQLFNGIYKCTEGAEVNLLFKGFKGQESGCQCSQFRKANEPILISHNLVLH